MGEHAPTPWRQVPKQPQYIVDAEGADVARMLWVGDDREANAEFIVRAVNSHEELLAALKALAEPNDDAAPYLHEAWRNTAKRAIAKAEGG